LTGQAQNPVNEYYKEMKDGTYKDYYKNGQLRIQYIIKNGNADSTHLFYYKNGQLKSSTNFDNGHFHGTNTEYNEKGDTTIIEKYRNDTLLVYKQMTYYPSGQLKYEQIRIFPTDSKSNPFLKSATNEINLIVKYDLNKSIKELPNTATVRKYHKNSNLKSLSYTVNNVLEGVFEYYDKNGQPTKTETWKKGKKLVNIIYIL
tara:strand:+ start:1428 stop:2033 length:606 start_codon:yes stop_codon:yes gene_type:complete